MFNNRKERKELLAALITSIEEPKIPELFLQNIQMLLLWGENDEIIKIQHALNMKEQIGDNVIIRCIDKAGHLAHGERPCVYNKYLNEFLASVHKK